MRSLFLRRGGHNFFPALSDFFVDVVRIIEKQIFGPPRCRLMQEETESCVHERAASRADPGHLFTFCLIVDHPGPARAKAESKLINSVARHGKLNAQEEPGFQLRGKFVRVTKVDKGQSGVR